MPQEKQKLLKALKRKSIQYLHILKAFVLTENADKIGYLSHQIDKNHQQRNQILEQLTLKHYITEQHAIDYNNQLIHINSQGIKMISKRYQNNKKHYKSNINKLKTDLKNLWNHLA